MRSLGCKRDHEENKDLAKLRWGILAAGGIAGAFTKDLIDNGLSVTAIGSRSAEKAERFADGHNIGTAHASYEALAADPDVDAIYIATPHPFHVTTAELAIRAGKHVLIEKPITINAAEAEHLRQLGEEHDVVVLEAMWTRFLPHMRRIHEILDAGTIGALRSLVATHTQDLPDDPGHRLNDLALGGGALLDLGIYPVSFTFDILGKPEQIIATGRLRPTGADAEVSTLFRYASGATALVLCQSDAPGPNTAQISGADGYIAIESVWYKPTAFSVFNSKHECIERYASPQIIGRGMHFQALELERLVATGERFSPMMPIAQSVAIMDVMDAIRSQIGVTYKADRKS